MALTLALLALLCSAAQAITVTVDGANLPGEAIARGGTTYVPLVELLSAFGTETVLWDGDSRTAAAETALFTLTVPVGQRQVLADGYAYPLSAPTLIHRDRTYVPLRAVANLLGGQVRFQRWDLPIAVTTPSPAAYTDEDLYWLSRVISAESRGESLLGQVAVGSVVLNRVASDQFPDTIREVVFDRKDAVQFEPVANGTIYQPPTDQSVLAAHLALNGVRPVEDCMYFFNPALSAGDWIRQNCQYHTTIGCHRFYR